MVMGVVNVTPDSFFPASRTLAAHDAIARGRAHFLAGCDIVDVGGESTRPGASGVGADQEIDRVLDVVAALAREGPVSVDTQKEAVARAAAEVDSAAIAELYR